MRGVSRLLLPPYKSLRILLSPASVPPYVRVQSSFIEVSVFDMVPQRSVMNVWISQYNLFLRLDNPSSS